jgi:hypothetical protein
MTNPLFQSSTRAKELTSFAEMDDMSEHTELRIESSLGGTSIHLLMELQNEREEME